MRETKRHGACIAFAPSRSYSYDDNTGAADRRPLLRLYRPRFANPLLNPENNPMKLSARNTLKGTIADVQKGQTTAHVRIDIAGTIMTASITNEAVDELKLRKGMTAYAVIKASDVMVAVD